MAVRTFLYHEIQGVYFKTNIVPDIDTRIELDNTGFIDHYGGYAGIISSEQGAYWTETGFALTKNQSYQTLEVRVGDSYQQDIWFTLGTRYNMVLDKTHFIIDGGEWDNYEVNMYSSYMDATNLPFVIGGRTTASNSVDYMCHAYVGNIRIYKNDVLVAEYKPSINNNNEYTFYDTVSGTFLERYGSGTVVPGPSDHTFYGSTEYIRTDTLASSREMTVYAQTGWAATTNNSWITVSPSQGGSGETTVTISVGDGAEANRTGQVTFVDADEYDFNVSVFQPKLATKVYLNRYKMGTTKINKHQRGSDNINKMYMGDELVYQKLSFAPTLSISVNSMVFNPTGNTPQTVTVNSNTDWRFFTTANWLNFTRSGNTLSIVPNNYSSELENRTTTVTITADNGDMQKTETISITQKKVAIWTSVDYVYTNSESYIDTGIYPTINTSFRVKLKQVNQNGNCTVGYSWSNTPIDTGDDNSDYRFFNYNGNNYAVFDFNSSRIEGYATPDGNGVIDVTCGNNYIYDNIQETTIASTTEESAMAAQNIPIYINLDILYAKMSEVIIYEDGVVVFDGKAAEVNGEYGLFDTVSDTLFQPTNGETVYSGSWSDDGGAE